MISAPTVDTRFRLTERQAIELSETYGTPLYVLDEAHFRARIRSYRNSFRTAYSHSEISFASKANSTLAVLAIVNSENCSIDVASEGELRAALAAGVPASRCHLHGNNKDESELAFAISAGISHIVVDSFSEIETIHRLVSSKNAMPGPSLVLRLAPGVDPVTHAKISTGQADTKFGFNIADGSARQATTRCLDLGLNLFGFHCHVGSQLLDPEAQRAGGELIAQFAVRMYDELGFECRYLNVGGGLGVMYTESDAPMPLEQYNLLVAGAVTNALEGSGLHPKLGQEPGRSLVGESGVTLYQVGVIKTVPAPSVGKRTYVAVNGGLSDNPRPTMYGSVYSVERVSPCRTDVGETVVTVSGKHCETDRLFADVCLPEDLAEGDLLQVLCTGAYNSTMANNYNRYPRPATVLIRTDASYSLVQRRETYDEMLAREIVPEGLG